MTLPTLPGVERRALGRVQVRAAAGGPPAITGHAAVFDQLSEDLGGWRERILPGAFARVLRNDVRALFNHDPNHVMGRTRAGTLRLAEDDYGLAVEIDPPAGVSWADDLIRSMERGDINQMSFGFTVDQGQEWQLMPDGSMIRTISEFAGLFDVSVVTFPAYPQTDAGVRSIVADIRARLQAPPPPDPLHAMRARRLALAAIDL